MDHLADSSPREVIEEVSRQLGCGTTSRDIAEYFDRHDRLWDLRQEFLVPKVADLPPCKFPKAVPDTVNDYSPQLLVTGVVP